MALWPFNRKKKLDESLLPDEVSEYYKGGKNSQNRGSWLLAVATMLVTAFLAVVLFFGGRWVFQTIFDNDDNNTQTTEQASDNQVEVKVTEPTDNTDSSSDVTNDSANTSSDSDSSTPTSDDSSASSEQTPTTGGISEIPDTGPGDGGLQ